MLESQSRANPAKAAAASKTDPKLIDPKLLQVKSQPDYKLDLSKPAVTICLIAKSSHTSLASYS